MTGALANVTREQRRQLDRDNARQPVVMTRVPESTWPVNVAMSPGRPQEVWRSRYFLAQVFKTRDGLRITISRTSVNTSTGRWQDEISWDELMSVKREIGRGSRWAYECYPADANVINVANMRHLWVPDTPPSFGWRS